MMEFTEYLAELRDPSARLSVAALQRRASLEREQPAALRSAWPQIEAERRRQVVHLLVELAEDNVDLNFDAVFFAALEDEDAAVRADAVRGLWEYEGRDLIAPLLRLPAQGEGPEGGAAGEGGAPRLKVSSLHAMGRSCDGRWLPVLIEELVNDDPEIRYEAATALGSLADRRAGAPLAGPLRRDASPSVQEAAAAAVAEADFGQDPLSVEYEL